MTSFRMFEIILYSMVSLLPYLGLALYPFEDKFRMSKIKLSGCIVILTVIQSALGIYATMCSQEQKALFSLLSTVCYGGFYFLAIKENVGKLVFVLLIVSNFANFVVMCAKCVEGHIFPQLAVENNKWSFSLCTMIVQLIFIPLLFLYFKKYIKGMAHIDTGKKIWRFLWTIPATFYLFWYHGLYFSTKSSIELAMDPVNMIFTFFINLGALVVYTVIVNSMAEFQYNLNLEEEKKQLEIENLCFENMKKQMESTRRARHDLKHHMKAVHTMAENNECKKITEYIETYLEHVSLKKPLVYCTNFTLNALIVYYVQQAEAHKIKLKLNIELPEETNVNEADLTVLFGNLLENAIDACDEVQENKRYINLKIYKPNSDSIVFYIENGFNGSIKKKNQQFLTTKANGNGIGIESVKYVVHKYNGDVNIKTDENKFIVSGVLLQPLDATK